MTFWAHILYTHRSAYFSNLMEKVSPKFDGMGFPLTSKRWNQVFFGGGDIDIMCFFLYASNKGSCMKVYGTKKKDPLLSCKTYFSFSYLSQRPLSGIKISPEGGLFEKVEKKGDQTKVPFSFFKVSMLWFHTDFHYESEEIAPRGMIEVSQIRQKVTNPRTANRRPIILLLLYQRKLLRHQAVHILATFLAGAGRYFLTTALKSSTIDNHIACLFLWFHVHAK